MKTKAKSPVRSTSRIPQDAVIEFTASPERDDPNDELRPQYDFDYSKARPNRFAGRVRYKRGGARPGAGRKPAPEPLVSKHVYLAARHIKILHRLDKNLSAAIRKLTDASQTKLPK